MPRPQAESLGLPTPGDGTYRHRPAIRSFALLDHVPYAEDFGPSQQALIVCPWLQGLPRAVGLWLSILPIHDCNACLEDDWSIDLPPHLRSRCYFGVFALDRLRSPAQILVQLQAKGVRNVINLPSVSFFDGATADTLEMLDFAPQAELLFLAQAKAAGFGVALAARAGTTLGPKEMAGLDFVLLHGGPGNELTVAAPVTEADRSDSNQGHSGQHEVRDRGPMAGFSLSRRSC